MDDRHTLANLIDPNALELDTYPWPRDAADRVLASWWLAARDARVRAETLERVAKHIVGPSENLRDAATCRDIAHTLRAFAAEYRKEADQ